MQKLLEALGEIWRKYKSQILLGLALLVTLIFLGVSCSRNRALTNQYNNNVTALTDTVELYKTKSGQLAAEKTLLEGDINLLKTTNEDLYKQIKDLKVKKPQQVVYVETEVVNEVHDTTYILQPSLPYQRKDFQFNSEWRVLEGFMELKDNLLGLNFTKDITYVDYTLAIKDNKVYMTSTNPYVQYREIQGLTLPKQRKPAWSFGVGPVFGVGYDIVNKNPGVYVGLGVNFSYSIISF